MRLVSPLDLPKKLPFPSSLVGLSCCNSCCCIGILFLLCFVISELYVHVQVFTLRISQYCNFIKVMCCTYKNNNRKTANKQKESKNNKALQRSEGDGRDDVKVNGPLFCLQSGERIVQASL